MLKFTAETIKPVLAEINEHHCALLLVKDQGVYVMSANGKLKNGRRTVAYAIGIVPACLPDRGELYDASVVACGGDDFAEELTLPPFLMSTLMEGNHDLVVILTESHMQVELWPSEGAA
ncbi:DUF3085 domain-containing protein [Yersinia pseudotuberculosis]|uniref:DUF3085 domain-containing protein n=1 Tax=Yersinia pseudotuberculosis TaxID=633 RepID=B7UF12_YERPU|nr:DUF3085 domain-containing protein [Yersinia pseudotuberculosis]MBO1552419.1 DUF3085 domain-containing protein [Yersinia pseudotuberculosis]MBO1563892.1 DUF3085 domain-containing protein [Yersinia pseudotuberculosis]MBO1572621.1 DUF3085 domain-containing protein [Yersinia pseudotuberculosis]MBO1587508.1 DUF3085 domain-containing protein [Yersinia pseudotuberculosis]MBO1631754.1 DUF3085 domain-containing protein [Yersinia pseudotuberculosis]